MAVQGAIQLDVVIDGKSYSIDKKNLSSLQVTRNLGDVANKFTLEVFDETAYQIENALAGRGQPSITVKYAAANSWSNNEYSSIVFTGVCIDYQVSFVGRATMLSLEGILSAARTKEGSVDWWFKKATINWCNADLEYDENGEETEIDGHSKEDATTKALDPNGTAANYSDPRDVVCAYEDERVILTTDPKTGETIESTSKDVYVNPSRIFRRIMTAYNQVYGDDSFPIAEIEESRWIKGIDTIQQDETAAEYITRVLCKSAITYTNNGSSELKDQVAGFQYFVDAQGHHFRRLNYLDSNSTNTIKLHFGSKDSKVISFTAANVGALAMAGFGTNDYGKILATSTTMDKLYGESITVGGENLANIGGGGTLDLREEINTSSNYFADMLKPELLDRVNITPNYSEEGLSAEYTESYLKLENLPFEAQLTVWGDYSNHIKPGNFINLLTYDTSGHSHYTTGTYYITEVVDDVSAEGFIQTITMIKNISAYSSGSINGDDATGMNKESDTGENVGTNNYTMPQQMKGSGLSDERIKNAQIDIEREKRELFNPKPVITVNPKYLPEVDKNV